MRKMFSITEWPVEKQTHLDSSEVLFHTWNDEDQSGHAFRTSSNAHPVWVICQLLREAGYKEMEYDKFEELGGKT